MGSTEDHEPILHSTKVKLYKNRHKDVRGAYVARNVNERMLHTADILGDMKAEGRLPGTTEEARNIINLYLQERNKRLADGFACTDGYTTLYPVVLGAFESPQEEVDPQKHKVVFHQHINKKLRELANDVKIEVLETVQTTREIDYLDDLEVETLPHNFFEPGNVIFIVGDKVKIEGDEKDNGVYFVPEDASGERVKMTRIAENYSTKIMGIVPDTPQGVYRLEIRTQYSGAGKPNQDQKVITSDFIVEAM